MPSSPSSFSPSRSSERFALAADVIVFVGDEQRGSGRTQNISFGGLAIVLAEGEVTAGEDVIVELTPLGGEPLRLTAHISWRRENGYGLQFTGTQRKERLAVQDLVAETRRLLGR